MFSAPIPPDDAERLATLYSYSVLDTELEQRYDDIIALATFICSAPFARVTFVDKDRQWFKSETGFGTHQTDRADGFCAWTVLQPEIFIVEDTLQDERFAENPFVLGDQRIRFYAGAPLVASNGHILGTVCVFGDKPRDVSPEQITALETLARQVIALLEQRKAIFRLEEAARTSEEAERLRRGSERRLEVFVDLLPALAWIANADGWIYWYNRRWYEYTGTTPEAMEGWGWQTVHDPKVLPLVMERWTASIKAGQPFEMVFPLKGADEVWRSFMTRVTPVHDEAGGVVQWFGTNTEVEELQSTKLALEKSEAGLRQVLTATKDAVVSVNRDSIVTYMNPAAEALYGAAEQFVRRNLWEAFPDEVASSLTFIEHYNRAMNQGISGSFEAEYGEPLDLTIGMEIYPSDEGIVTFSRDVTKLKHAAQALLESEKLAAVGRLASSIAHEVNNPLEAVTNLLYLSRTAQTLEEALPYLVNADLELRRASAITNQTLRFHRQVTRPIWATFNQLIQGILVGQHSRLTNAGVRVKQRDKAVRPVCCLEGEIRQVLGNLIGNAIDSMHGRGGTLYIRGRDGREWKSERTGMLITVADTGTGMSEATRAKVFNAFYTTKGISGTGLGLWISKEIVDRHRGMLRLRTSQRMNSSGTVFTLFIPDNSPGEHTSVNSPEPDMA